MQLDELKQLRQKLQAGQKAGARQIEVCGGTGCSALGSKLVTAEFQRELSRRNLLDKVPIRVTGCQGFCERGPVVTILPEGIFYPQITPQDVGEIIDSSIVKDKLVERLQYIDPRTGEKAAYDHQIPFYNKQMRIVLRDNGRIDPTDINDYIARDGYLALEKVISGMTPEQIIQEVSQSGLRGRGGAGFPTGKKWHLARIAAGEPKYLVCNGDEGDPGAFMDRSVMEGNPHLVLEGMMIAAYAIGASIAYIYVRSEYPLAVKNLNLAIDRAGGLGLLGKNILDSAFSLEIKVIEGAGAFVCGEETALMASIEGNIGRPRPRPPFPAQKGLWGKPTNINNVETLATVPAIIRQGGQWYAGLGTETSKGTKIFSLTGTVNNTGLVEVPMGTLMGEMIYDIGGGIPKGRKFKAAQIGGPSGGCLPTKYLGLPIDYESLSKIGAIMGSGGLVVMDESTCMVDIARYFLSFTQAESCGKCTPCRLGTKRMLEILTRITRGEGAIEDIELLTDLAESIKDSSLCGLGQSAPNPVLSTIKHFRNEYEAHILQKRCPASVCEELVYAPCEHTCPVNVDAVGYIALIGQGRFEEALDLERQRNPLAGICGRVCHHPCEQRCRRGDVDQPVAIAALKRAAADFGAGKKTNTKIDLPKQRTERVAIVGSGPAGLNAAYHLTKFGYRVTVFEALPVAGGMLWVGIPEFRLPRKVLKADINFIKRFGVDIRLNMRLGKQYSLEDLLRDGYKSVLLAFGAHQGSRMGMEGESLKGVFDGVSFLKKVNLKKKVKVGKRVLIIGGGNVALDAARSSLRLGATQVTILYRRSREDMPASNDEIHEAEQEGIKILDMTDPIKISGQDGRITSLLCQRTRPGEYDSSGRRRPQPITGSEFTIEADTLIAAIGQKPETGFLEKEDFNIHKNGTIVVDESTLSTGRPGVFAAGDMVTGPATVLEAMASGEQAAISIHRYLNGLDLKSERYLRKKEPVDVSWREKDLELEERQPMPELLPTARISGFSETNLGFTRQTATKEARRCLRCDLEDKAGK